MDPTSCVGCTQPSLSKSHPLVGWTPESPGRGTLTIVISCMITTFLCTWVVIHPRVSGGHRRHVLHKIILFLKCIVAPEFIAVEGLHEWMQARRMVKQNHEVTKKEFKPIHAFYIEMLGLRYRTQRGSRVLWPNQFSWLLDRGLLDWDDHVAWGLAEDMLRDKSDADSGVKLVTLIQVSWFVAQSIMRRAHTLPLSQLETMTLSYIPLVAVTYFFWWSKPKDIMTPSIVDLPAMSAEQAAQFDFMTVSSLFDDEKEAHQNSLSIIWLLTPRVFEKEAADRALHEYKELDCKILCTRPNASASEQGESWRKESERYVHNETGEGSRPAREGRVVACWDPDVYHSKILWPFTCLFAASFGALHLISWKAEFPTDVEQWLWRMASLVSIVSMLVFMQFEKVVLRWGGPLTLLSLASPFIYLLSRVVMMAEVIAAFRAANPRIYDTYFVSNYWLHAL